MQNSTKQYRFFMAALPLAACLTMLLGRSAAGAGRASDARQTFFDDWDLAPTAQTGVHTHAGWVVRNGAIWDVAPDWSDPAAPSSSGQYAAWLDSANAWVRAPVQRVGVNRVWFSVRNRSDRPRTSFAVQTSHDGEDWTTVQTFTHENRDDYWTTYHCRIDIAEPVHVRVARTDAVANQYLGLSFLALVLPPSHVVVSDATLEPDPPRAGEPTHVSARIEPRALASNIQARVRYTLQEDPPPLDEWKAATMTNTAGYGYATSNAIPAVEQDQTVHYVLEAVFEGVHPQSPARRPAEGSATYTVAEP